MRIWTCIAAGAAVAITSGCFSSSYVPKNKGQISVVTKGGNTVYMRDGNAYRHGWWGSGLVKAVRGNPAAERAARTYRRRTKIGAFIIWPSFLCAGVAWGLAEDEGENDATAESVVMAGCLLVGVIGTFYSASGYPYRNDAINIFNDSTNPTLRGAPGYRDPYGRPYGAKVRCETKTDRERHPIRCAHRSARR